MKKILPSLYKGETKNISKNQSKTILTNEKKQEITDNNNQNVNTKIKDIFNSPKYVYKADVSITLTDGTNIKKTIIGRTNNSLITIDDELIEVNKISKIEFY